MQHIEVSSLNEQIKSLIESTFLQVSVVGEVSRATYHSSGHLYFNLKDKNSSIKCVMFRGNNSKLKFKIEDGMQIIVHGSVSVYIPNGNYQIMCTNITLDGQGDLQFAFEQLKKKLESKGYFEYSRKKELPLMPKNVALLTSKTGAALQDMIRIANKRWPLVKLTLINTLVQGESAASIIASNLKYADSLGFDVIVLARGGGSLEDLWCFNDEKVADTIYELKTPIISAIGHEIDFMISDFVADMRASTPSNAMEILLPDRNDWLLNIDTLMRVGSKMMQQKLVNYQTSIKSIENSYKQNSIKAKISLYKSSIYNLLANFKLIQQHTLKRYEDNINSLAQNYETLKPNKQLKDSFVQITKNGKKSSLKKIKKDDIFTLEDGEFVLTARAVSSLKV